MIENRMMKMIRKQKGIDKEKMQIGRDKENKILSLWMNRINHYLKRSINNRLRLIRKHSLPLEVHHKNLLSRMIPINRVFSLSSSK